MTSPCETPRGPDFDTCAQIACTARGAHPGGPMPREVM